MKGVLSTDGALAERQAALRIGIEELIHEYFATVPPMPAASLPLAVPLYGADEVMAALDVLLEQRVTMGDRVREFEGAFAEFIGTRHAIMVNSGSSANLLALSVLSSERLPGRLRAGDEVIVPAVTWPTTVSPVLQLGCVPVIVDVDETTLNLDQDSLEAALSPRTRAIFAVHLLGNPIDMPRLMAFAKKHDLLVIEDTCESLGSSSASRRVGSFGEFGTFSFYFSHHMTTIEGGMLVTEDDALADLARSMRAHGWTRDLPAEERRAFEEANPAVDARFLFVNLGYNVRPTEMQAAFGLVQLRRLNEFNARRRANAQFLLDALRELDLPIHLVNEQGGGRSTWFGFALLTDGLETRIALSQHLESRGIETRPIVAGNLAAQPAFRSSLHRTVGDLPAATRIGERGLFFGNHPSLTQEHLSIVVDAFREFFDGRP